MKFDGALEFPHPIFISDLDVLTTQSFDVQIHRLRSTQGKLHDKGIHRKPGLSDAMPRTRGRSWDGPL